LSKGEEAGRARGPEAIEVHRKVIRTDAAGARIEEQESHSTITTLKPLGVTHCPDRTPCVRLAPVLSPQVFVARVRRVTTCFLMCSARKLGPVISTKCAAWAGAEYPNDAPMAPGARRTGLGTRRLDPRRLRLGVVPGAVPELRRGDGRGPGQGLGGVPAKGPAGTCRPSVSGAAHHGAGHNLASERPCGTGTSSWSRPAISFWPTARSSRAWPRSTRRPSPARARP
jgi:hypothetical protein